MTSARTRLGHAQGKPVVFRDVHGLRLVIQQDLEAAAAAAANVARRLTALDAMSGHADVQRAAHCKRCRAEMGRAGVVCQYCQAEDEVRLVVCCSRMRSRMWLVRVSNPN